MSQHVPKEPHSLKVWPKFFEALRTGAKTFEAKKDDRVFVVGDELVLREWSPTAEHYTGRMLRMRITYILRGDEAATFGVAEGFVILGLQALDGTEKAPVALSDATVAFLSCFPKGSTGGELEGEFRGRRFLIKVAMCLAFLLALPARAEDDPHACHRVGQGGTLEVKAGAIVCPDDVVISDLGHEIVDLELDLGKAREKLKTCSRERDERGKAADGCLRLYGERTEHAASLLRDLRGCRKDLSGAWIKPALWGFGAGVVTTGIVYVLATAGGG